MRPQVSRVQRGVGSLLLAVVALVAAACPSSRTVDAEDEHRMDVLEDQEILAVPPGAVLVDERGDVGHTFEDFDGNVDVNPSSVVKEFETELEFGEIVRYYSQAHEEQGFDLARVQCGEADGNKWLLWVKVVEDVPMMSTISRGTADFRHKLSSPYHTQPADNWKPAGGEPVPQDCAEELGIPPGLPEGCARWCVNPPD